ncbi:MAG TPA: glucoamylase family protein [Cyclobacteriaceae bacterium]|nr:glucoamylase family protein [Cyclobacteriaceae bacterium]
MFQKGGEILKPVLGFVLIFVTTVVLSQSQKGKYGDGPDEIPVAKVVKGLTDEQLLETVQKQTFRFFWHGAHPVSGLALERSNTVLAEHYWDYINEAWDEPNFSTTKFGPDAAAIGGTGFGIMSTVIAVERNWIGRDTAVRRLIKIADFLINADCYHGIYPHFMNGRTGKTIKFDRLDDGADIVETSYLLMGFLCAKEYFNRDTPREKYLRKRIDQMWGAANWNWHTNNQNKLYWHWSPNNDFDMNFPVWGWNECLITYIMAASSQHHAISKKVYDGSWVGSGGYKNGKEYYGYKLPLGNFDKGGPLFFVQYTFQGIDPTGLKDSLGTDYFEQGKNHTLINRAYCIENPKKYKGYSDKCWGLTAGDSYKGYVAHCPEVDFGVVQPTAAISSMPYTPKESLQALRYFYEELGDKIWSDYGFVDGFSIHHNWYAKSHLAIDQGPIIVMLENYRTGLLWKLFMKNPDLQKGLKKLGFTSPHLKK